MEYDMVLIRTILEYVAEHGHGRPLYHPEVEGHSDDDVELHVRAMVVDKLIDASKTGHARSLTIKGQGMLDELRKPKEPK